MSTNYNVIALTVTITSLAIGASTIHGMAADAGDATLDLIEANDAALRPIDGRGNGAATYLRAFAALDNANITTDEWLTEGSSPRHAKRWDPERASSLLEKSAEAISISRAAARLPWAAFGSDQPRERGAIMPHLTPMRRLSRLMGMQARMHRIEGRDIESSAMLRDICLIAHHAASDNVPIASLAASACALQAIEGIEEAIALGAIESTDASRFREVLGAGLDPFGYADAVASEREATLEWLHNDLPSALEEYRIERGAVIANSPYLFDDVRAAFDEVESILRTEDPTETVERTATFESALADGTYGALAQHLLVNHARIIGIKLHMQKRVRTLDAKLRAIQLGRDPLTLANAAVLYEYAFSYIHSIEQSEQEALEMVRSFVSVLGTTDGLPERAVNHARKALVRLKPARALVARAASCEQCTWEEAETAERLGLAIGEGSWVRPMRALARICEVEGALAISDGRYQDANRAIADALAVALHLADGSHLLGSVVAAATVVEVAELSALIVKLEGLHDSRALIEERLARIDRKDPLSWKASRETTLRSRLQSVLSRRFAVEESSIASQIPQWNLDRLASVTYVLQNRSGRFGALLSLDDVVIHENTEGSDSHIRATGDPLDKALMIIDATQPIRTEKWRTLALLALDSIQDDLSHSPKRLAGSSLGP